jgi:NAD(P)-dependent dehydrogenase (short-subunit alcohol dehydrogenase family)
MVDQGTGGSLILVSSIAGLVAFPNLGHYTAAKHGLTGLMRALAAELAPYGIRVNSVHPGTVDTTMVANEASWRLFTGGQSASREDAVPIMKAMTALGVPWVEPDDISNAVLYLASDESRYVTGTTAVIDAGTMMPFKVPPS